MNYSHNPYAFAGVHGPYGPPITTLDDLENSEDFEMNEVALHQHMMAASASRPTGPGYGAPTDPVTDMREPYDTLLATGDPHDFELDD